MAVRFLRKLLSLRRALSLLARPTAGASLALLLFGGVALAQQAPARTPIAAPPSQTMSYHKQAQGTAAPAPVSALPPQPLPAVKQASLQPAPAPAAAVDPSDPRDLFKVESEAKFQEQIQRDLAAEPTPGKLVLPDPPVLARGQFDPFLRSQVWPLQSTLVPPSYVCHGRLLFEQRNAERYGWAFGPFHPVISTGLFFADVVTLPYHVAKFPCRKCECSAGLCLPGDPVPLLLYPPEWSLAGLAAEAATVAVLVIMFP
jgi:hypothetical protein